MGRTFTFDLKHLLTSKLLSAVYAENPRTRAKSVIIIGHNTTSRKSYRCAVCGAQGPTFSAKWQETKASLTWREEHEAEHMENALIEHRASLPEVRRIACDAESVDRHDEGAAIRMTEVVP